MITFRDRITQEMRRYQHVPISEGDFTIGALVGAARKVHDDKEALAFWQGYLRWMRNAYPDSDAASVCRSNIGWCFGEGMPTQDKDMWVRVCNASHPVFGQASVTPEQAFAAGIAQGKGSSA